MLGTRSWGVGGGGWTGGWVLVLGWVSLNDDYTTAVNVDSACVVLIHGHLEKKTFCSFEMPFLRQHCDKVGGC